MEELMGPLYRGSSQTPRLGLPITKVTAQVQAEPTSTWEGAVAIALWMLASQLVCIWKN